MAQVFYTATKGSIGAASTNLSSVTIDAYLIDAADYTASASHSTLADVPSGARVAGPVACSTSWTSSTATLATTANVVFSNITGDASEAVLFVVRGSSQGSSDSKLLVYNDSGTGLPTATLSSTTVTVNSGNIYVL